MSNRIIDDRIKLFSIIDSFGVEGGTLKQIQEEFKAATGVGLDRRQFMRCTDDIENMLNVKINCRRAGANSRYYVEKSDLPKYKEDYTRMCCMNAFLLNNVTADARLNNNRVYIADSYGNMHAKIVADALLQRSNIRVKNHSREFDFAPYAMIFSDCWYMFGKIPGNDDLLVFSLNDVIDSRITECLGDVPESFDLKVVLDNFTPRTPGPDGIADDSLMFWMGRYKMKLKI